MTPIDPSHPHHHPDLSATRNEYERGRLDEQSAGTDPYALFDTWLDDAYTARDDGLLVEPTAMVVSTAADGQPSSRTVLLKGADERGFVFYTNYASRKAGELAAEPRVALLFAWYPLQRQVRVEGIAGRVPRAESEAYFATRPRGSQLGAWASHQSAEVTMAGLQESMAAMEQRFAGGEVPCPPFWGGYRVRPERIEFWQGRPSRLHDRLLFRRDDAGSWVTTRLAP